jgi:hypothetical protein
MNNFLLEKKLTLTPPLSSANSKLCIYLMHIYQIYSKYCKHKHPHLMHIYQTYENFGLWIHILQIQKYEIYYMRIINVYILPY